MTTPVLLFQNGAASSLASGITPLSTTCTVVAGQGALFPNPAVGPQVFLATLIDAATGAIKEIVKVVERDGDLMTIARAQENTSALAWNAGDSFKQLITAGTAQTFAQLVQVQSGSYNFAQDTGGVNSYVAALTPPITTRISGLKAYVKATNANTGASTLDLGAGPVSIVNPDGSALGTGAIVGGGIFEVIDTGSGPYQLISSSQQAQSSAGAATTGDIKWRPTSETITGWIIANTTTIGNASSNATQRANADTANAFAWHWNNFSNSKSPVFTSGGVLTTRGANAAADFAANKQIQVFDLRGMSPIGVDTMGGPASTNLSGVPVQQGSTTTPGSIVGENLHALIVAELPTGINSTVTGVNSTVSGVNSTVSGVSVSAGGNGQVISTNASYSNSPVSTGSGLIVPSVPPGQQFFVNPTLAQTGTGSATQTGTGSAAQTGTGSATSNNTLGHAHNTVHLSQTGYWYIKL